MLNAVAADFSPPLLVGVVKERVALDDLEGVGLLEGLLDEDLVDFLVKPLERESSCGWDLEDNAE